MLTTAIRTFASQTPRSVLRVLSHSTTTPTDVVALMHDEHPVSKDHAKPGRRTQSKKEGTVSLFWDMENCGLRLRSKDGYTVEELRRSAEGFGRVKILNAYLDKSHHATSKSLSAFHSQGFDIIDCPHNGERNVVDMRMIDDMMAWATNNPAPDTVVLIAGDKHYKEAVSNLSKRGYNVIVIAPPKALTCMRAAQPAKVLPWRTSLGE
ncbi:hypothetical protein POSPLADRAFT_1071922 [Postia placenta MAD-698-R-SB12]|uniref:NYN domain-containing protein n=1 Tax=Postia placenta MAD-698-R-SB12 TaxID=670580 RepID=A0A1X6MJ21_9APHY|nr:hypothetical protein POSPLADRAFT_1071922 [Postia placenta MAD-698-R-SB12]OSX56437.1 hypothetical protein POSPLADRAFT_1071922 [Postia placenta MAD-698-R-SB12]